MVQKSTTRLEELPSPQSVEPSQLDPKGVEHLGALGAELTSEGITPATRPGARLLCLGGWKQEKRIRRHG